VYPTWPEAATYTVNYLVHGANFCVMAADCLLSSQPYPLRYGAALAPYGFIYVTFTLIYYAAGGVNEWGQPWIYLPIYWGAKDHGAAKGGALCLAVLLFVVPGLVLAAWAAARARDDWARDGGGGSSRRRSGGAEGAEEEEGEEGGEGAGGGGDAAPARVRLRERRGDPLRRGLLHPLREEDDDEEEHAEEEAQQQQAAPAEAALTEGAGRGRARAPAAAAAPAPAAEPAAAAAADTREDAPLLPL
jgi:hypothetical protein